MKEGAERGGRGMFVMHMFGDREGFQKECRRAIVQSLGYDTNRSGQGEKREGRENGEEGEWDFDLLPSRVRGMISVLVSYYTSNYS